MTIVIYPVTSKADFVFPEFFFQLDLIHYISRYRLNFWRPSLKDVFILFVSIPAFISKTPFTLFAPILGSFALGKDGTIQQSIPIVELYSIRRLVHALDVIEFKSTLAYHVVPNNLRGMAKCKFRIDGPFHKFTTIYSRRSPLVSCSKEFFQMDVTLIIDAFDSEEMRSAAIVILDGIALRQIHRVSVFCKHNTGTKPTFAFIPHIVVFRIIFIIFIAFTFEQNAHDIAIFSIDSDHL